MAGEIKTNWDNPVLPSMGDLGGDLSVGARGTDPLIDFTGTSALQTFHTHGKEVVAIPDGQETPNSVSGLPLGIRRVEATDQPPPPPGLKDRAPGLVDQS